MIFLLKQYAIINESISFSLTHVNKKGNRQRIFKTNGKNMLNNIAMIYGSKFIKNLQLIDEIIPLENIINQDNDEQNHHIKLKGYISKIGYGRAQSDIQILYLNNRPVDISKIMKKISAIYRKYSKSNTNSTSPILLLNIMIPSYLYDINVTPNKRQVFLHYEQDIIDLFEQYFTELLEPASYTYEIKRHSNNSVVHNANNQMQDITSLLKKKAQQDNDDKLETVVVEEEEEEEEVEEVEEEESSEEEPEPEQVKRRTSQKRTRRTGQIIDIIIPAGQARQV